MTVGLTLSSGSKESHGKQIYCASFSDDIHVGYTVPARNSEAAGLGEPLKHKDKREVIVIDSSSDDEKIFATDTPKNDNPFDDTSSFQCYYMATCAGNTLTLYQVRSSGDNKSSNDTMKSEDADFLVRQVYKDADQGEIFYSCIFAGRCRNRGEGFESTPFSNVHRSIQSSASNYHSNLIFHQDEENYDGPQLCCVGGKRGVIKIIDTVQQSLIVSLIGHTDELYDLKVSNRMIVIE